MSRLTFLRFKKNTHSPSLNALDQKLVREARRGALPSLAQLKYFPRFFTRGEKILFSICLGVALFSFSILTAAYFTRHLYRIPADGGEYSEALIGQPKFINPLFASASDVDQDLSSLVYVGLFRVENQQLQPDLAAGFTVSTDTKSYDITLKKDLKFADGEPLTASDVVYTFDLIENQDSASPLYTAFQGVKIEKIDDLTVRFTLKAPFAAFLSTLTVGILPEHLWNETNPNSLRLSEQNLKPIGAGPWKFSKMVKDSSGNIDSLIYSRNDHYYGKKPYFNTLRFKFFDDYGGALEAVRSQSVDAISFLPRTENSKLNTKTINEYAMELPQYSALFFNQAGNAALKDDNVREALAEAIDKEKIVSEGLSGFGEVIDSPILSGMLGFDKDATTTVFNPDDANDLLDKSWTRVQPEEYFKIKHDELVKGIAAAVSSTDSTSTVIDPALEESLTKKIRQGMDPDQTFYRKDKDGHILELTIITADTAEYGPVADLIVKNWGKIGVKATVQKVGATRLVRDVVRNRAYTVLLYGEIVGNDPDPYPFWHSSQADYPGLNLSGFSDRNADKLLEDARAAIDDNTRADLYKKFASLVKNETPAVFLYTPVHTMAINKEIKGVNFRYINAPFDRYDDLPNWYVKMKFRWN